MGERYFSPEEVERLIPALTRLMGTVRAGHTEAGELRDRLRAEQERITMSGGGFVDRQAWKADRARLERLSTEIQKALDGILGLGGVPKDLGLGLVDFPHLRAGQVVNLCWQYGEREIRYWHGLDEGYAARKRLP